MTFTAPIGECEDTLWFCFYRFSLFILTIFTIKSIAPSWEEGSGYCKPALKSQFFNVVLKKDGQFYRGKNSSCDLNKKKQARS